MPLVLEDRVQETATANTTVSFTLTGAVQGFQTFNVVGNANTTYYSAFDGAGNWEVGLGTYSTTGPTLTRNTVYASSNSNLAVTFPGVLNVFVTYPADKSVNLDASGNVSSLGTVSSGTWQGTAIGVAYGGTGVTSSSGANSVVLRDSNQNTQINRVDQTNNIVAATGVPYSLSAASAAIHTFVGSPITVQIVVAPNATTLPVGAVFTINNDTDNSITLHNFANVAIGSIPAGGAAQLTLLANPAIDGTWGIHAFLPEGATWGTNALNLGTAVVSGGTWQGGTIQSGYGGTGLTSFVGANNALYSTNANTLTAGVLPVAAGGTGTSTPSLVAGTNVTISGTWPNQTIAASGGGGGGGFDVGEIVESAVAPSTGTWLACGGYYSKALYPSLAAELGNIPDMGAPASPPENKLLYPTNVPAGAPGAQRYLLATDGTRYVCVGSNNTSGFVALTSTDNITWNTTPVNWPDAQTPAELRYLNGKFILVGSNTICTSSDGLNWRQTYTASAFIGIASVAYGAGVYVASTTTVGITCVSADGETWTNLINQGSSTFTGGRIAFGNTRFVNISYSNGATLYSTDGYTWTSGTSGLASASDMLFANGLFVAMSPTTIRTSADGITWSTAFSFPSTYTPFKLVYVNSNFIVMGQAGVYYSPDGITWTLGLSYLTTNASLIVRDVVWDGTQYLYSTNTGKILASSSLSGPWTLVSTPSIMTAGANLIAAFNSRITAFGETTYKVTTTTSVEVIGCGRRSNYEFNALTNPDPTFGAHVAYNGVGRYVLVSNNQIYTATNPFGSWSLTAENLAPWGPRVVAYQNGNFIAAWGTLIGASTLVGGIFYSSDGLTWNIVTGLPINNPVGFYWTGTVYVLVHNRGVLTSPDLITWTARLSLGSSLILFVNVAAGVIVIGGLSGSIYTSATTDGITWTNRTTGTSTLNGAIYSPTLLQWIAYGASGTLLRSTDNTATWASIGSGIAQTLQHGIWTGTFWAICAQAGDYITSTNGTTWTSYRWANTNSSNRFLYLDWDGTNLLMSSGGGAYVISNTQGVTWNQLSARKGLDEESLTGQFNTLNVWRVNNIYFSIGITGVEVSTDFTQWRVALPRNFIYAGASRLTVAGSYLYLINSTGGTSYSTNGEDFTPLQDLPVTTTAITYGAGVYIAFAGTSTVVHMPQVYRSTNGLDWTLVRNFGNIASITTNISWSAATVDVAYANGAYLLNFSGAQALNANIPTVVWRSTDGGLTWSSGMTIQGYAGNQFFGRFASDGTTLMVTSVSGGMNKSTDGGATWSYISQANNLNVAYSDSKWVLNSNGPTVSVSTDATNWVMTSRNGFGAPQQFVISGNYLITASSQFGFAIASLTGGNSVLTNIRYVVGLANNVWQDKRFIKANNKVLFLAARNYYAVNPRQNLIVEIPLYSYDTATTFYVPPSNGLQPSWIYAGT